MTDPAANVTTCHKSLTKLYHTMLYISPWWRFELTTSVMISTDCIDSCKSNYHTITTTTENSFKSVNSNQYKHPQIHVRFLRHRYLYLRSMSFFFSQKLKSAYNS
jgi:hypothetical protein